MAMQYPNFTVVPDEPRTANAGSTGGDGDKPAAAKNKPAHALPSPRVRVAVQLELLKAYAVGSNFGGATTTYIKAAELAGIGPNSASLCNAFFYDAGLIVRADSGVVPTQPVIEYARALDWGREDAATKLATAIRNTWFAQTLVMHLKMRSISVTEAIQKLAEEAAAGKEHQPALRMCVEYLEVSGVVRRNGDQLQLATVNETPPQTDPAPEMEEEEMTAEPSARPPRPSVVSGFPQPSSGGSIRLAFDVTVTMAEMATWDAARITAFFAGVAQVLAAKHGNDPAE
jgi:hypothetical protein